MDERRSHFNRLPSRKDTAHSISSKASNNESINDKYYAEPTNDQVYSGPGSESIPSSYTSFHHRRLPSRSRGRRSSNVLETTPGSEDGYGSYVGRRSSNRSHSSFRFFTDQEVEMADGASTLPNDLDPVQYEALQHSMFTGIDSDMGGEESGSETDDYYARYPRQHPRRYSYESRLELMPSVSFRQSGGHMHRSSTDLSKHHEDELLSSVRRSSHDSHGSGSMPHPRRDSMISVDSPLLDIDTYPMLVDWNRTYPSSQRKEQRFYVSEEDLMVCIAGYKSSIWRIALGYLVCLLTFGLGFLVLRWFPKWRVWTRGYRCALGVCDWLVVENQWGELAILNVQVTRYGGSLSTVFRVNSRPNTASDTSDMHSTSADSTQSNSDNLSRIQEDSNPTMPSLRCFEYRYLKFIYNPVQDLFLTNHDWVDSAAWGTIESARQGLDSETARTRHQVFGSNIIDIKSKGSIKLLIDEALHPFYVFQVFSIILWLFDSYYYYAACILIISIFTVGSTLVETKTTLRRMREIARYECDVKVIRNGFWKTISSSDLVPGDVFEVSDPEMTVLPCDAILLSGDCIVNESMLTGESVPVSKIPATTLELQQLITPLQAPAGLSDDDSEITSPIADLSTILAKHFLSAGTKIIRARRPHKFLTPKGIDEDGEDFDVAVAVVIKTGFTTTKGALVRSMIFPRPSGFKFYQDSFKYVGVMAIIAVLGFCFSAYNFVKLAMPLHLIIVRALDLITVVVPPALPATLSIGTNLSLARLRSKGIFCISPSRVNFGGRIDVVCFDKTGTLTEDGLDVLGLQMTDSRNPHREKSFLPLIDDENKNHINKHMTAAMATCHSLRCVDTGLIGDPLDLKMFEFVDSWTIQEHVTPGLAYLFAPRPGTNQRIAPHVRISIPSQGLPLATLRTFEFASQLRRMSVVVKQQGSRDAVIYTKGAPEVIREICDPSSMPPDYDQCLLRYTHQGYRVIACAMKLVSNIDVSEVCELQRSEVEADLTFLGFVIFENKLKPRTSSVISELRRANIRTIMCTGDNVLTAISVAKECGMIMSSEVGLEPKIYAPHFEDECSEKPSVVWACVNDPDLVLDSHTMAVLNDAGPVPISLAVTGDVFRYISQFGTNLQMEKILTQGVIFARMSPDEKHELVEKLKSIDYTTAFCGDGANDCGALKAAHVGVSLSEAEASVAAPFTSQVFDISCVLDVIKEGRAALVTSFSCFKYMSLYSAIQFTSVVILYSMGSNLGDFEFLWIDMFVIIPIAASMAWSEPYPSLGRKKPTANLVSRKVLIPLIGHILCLSTFQVLLWRIVVRQPWRVQPVKGAEDDDVPSSDNTALFLFSCFQYLFIAVLLSVGPPFRQPTHKNKPFIVAALFSVISTCLFVALPRDTWIIRLLGLVRIPSSFSLLIYVLAATNFALCYAGDRHFYPVLSSLWASTSRKFGLVSPSARKRYKELLNAKLEC